MKITIGIADDHPIVLDGLKNLLSKEETFCVQDTYQSGSELLEILAVRQPDILLLDIQFPDASGIDLVKIILDKYPKVKVIALTSVDNPMDIKEMIRNGCKGYLLKNVKLDTLIHAVKEVYEGREYLEPGMKDMLLKALIHPPAKKKPATQKLTQREQRILELVAEGKTNGEIADELFLSYRTIQNNRLSLYQKFNVQNTAGLIKMAMQIGLIK